MTFEELKLTRQFLDAVKELGYESPSEIQEKVIPRVLGGQDVIGIAQTGTGKTAAYVLPLLQLLKYPQGDEPRALILVPTKELVVQVEEQIQSLCKYTELRYVALYGGVGPKTQIEIIKKGVDIIVATPGRFLEIYAKRVIIPKKIKHVVLDECDRMMDMGFWPQLREIQEKLPQKKQQLLFSATFPERVERIADNFLLFPSRVEVTPQATPATTVEQRVYMVPNFKTKLNLLMHLLEGDEMKRVMVFVRTKADATSMGKFMERSNVGEIRFLHSNIGQNSRMNAIKEFKDGNVRILVSTDVTARGIDVFEVSHVVNFQVPGHYEDYVHRIGRTGRAFKTGVAISFVDQSEEYHLTNIQKIIRQTIPVFEIPEAVKIEKTEPEEKQDHAREIDRQKRLDDPDFKGAFHEKKTLQAKLKFKQERDKKQRRNR
jgi:ATP-dependent RNA helicase RhlE